MARDHPPAITGRTFQTGCLSACVGDDAEVFRVFVDRLRKAKSEAEAVKDAIHKRFSEIKPAQLPEMQRKRLYAMTDLLLYPRYSAVYRPIAVYRDTDDTIPPKTYTIYESMFKNEPSAAGDPKRIRWESVRKLQQCYVSALKAQGIGATSLDVVIDVPFGKNSMRHVEWYDDTERRERKFESLTHVGKTFFDKPAEHWSPVRVYISSDLLNGLRPEVAIVVRNSVYAKFL